MLRISGVTIPGNKRVEIGLTAIRGIGRPLSARILNELKIDLNTKVDALSEAEQGRIRVRVEKELVEGELGRKISLDVKRLQDIGTWRGYRHRRKMPVRGQTSRRNARTKRGKKKTGTSGRTTLTKT
ncbi:MAG: 30S ribosomal protein S13 [Candidatus Binatia bacterium]|nr:30S ribosomal protein S13 [Candidatus Binatia bacterium]